MLTTLVDVKEYLGITGTDYDALITHLITRVEKAIANYCGWVFEAANYSEQYDGAKFNGGVLILKQFPVISVTSLFQDGTRAFAVETLIDPSKYVVYNENGILQLDGEEFDIGLQTIKAVYRAGYEDGSIPGDLTLVANDMVGWKMEDRKTAGGSITSRRLADAAITYDTSGGAVAVGGGIYVPKSAVGTLERYKYRKMYVI